VISLVLLSEALCTANNLKLRMFGERTNGEVLERGVRRVHQRRQFHLDDFVAQVAFFDRVGHRREAAVSLTRARWSMLQAGSHIAIAYDSTEPSRAVCSDELSQVDHDLLIRAAWGLPLLMLAIGLRRGVPS
jgi:hypothetical protein